jgi:hypothetical protein
MDKEFVTYEQALALKELGFDEMCFGFYSSPILELMHCKNSEPWMGNGVVSAPLKQQLFRWFREKKLHNNFPSIIQTRNWATLYRILEWHPGNDSTSITTSDYYDTYEEAENACIDKLIEIVKQQDNG